MRNGVIARNAAAQHAANQAIADGGGAVDAVLAGMFAGAAYASTSALLGSCAVMVAGAGAGAYRIEGFARTPGMGDKRRAVPDEPPGLWRAAVPGLLEGALAAHNRFGTVSLGTVTRAAANAVSEFTSDVHALARAKLVHSLASSGVSALSRLGVTDAVIETAGVAMGGTFTRDDLVPFVPAVEPLAVVSDDEFDLLVSPEPPPPPRHAPPPPPRADFDAIIALDMLGVIACCVWALPEEAAPLRTDTGVSLAALATPPRKGVPRGKAGDAIPLPTPAVFVRHQGRAWAGVAAAGRGDGRIVCVRWIERRLANTSIPKQLPPSLLGVESHFDGVSLQAGYDARGEVVASHEAHRVR